jgi:dipeptidyl aminopeptidase/acylaminoacyl peptidase
LSLPYGSWPSPISAASVVEGSVGLGEVVVDESVGGGAVWWAESLPSERGRVRLVRRSADGTVAEMTPCDANVRTRVHTYGGGAWWAHGGVVVYCDDTDGQLRRLDSETGDVVVLTDTSLARYADGRIVGDPRDGLYVCVRERHDTDATGGGEAVTDLVAVALDGSGEVTALVGGSDFFAEPRPSADGTRLAWLSWNHPNMPWDGTELWVGDLDAAGKTVSGSRRLAGGLDEWIAQPRWIDGDQLGWVTDAGGWSRIRRVDVTSGDAPGTWVDLDGAEIAAPPWVFGRARWGVTGAGQVVHASSRPAGDVVAVGSATSEADTAVSALDVGAGRVVFVGGAFDRASQIVEMDLDGNRRILASPNGGAPSADLDQRFLAAPEPVAVPTDRGETTHALLYRPANPGVTPPAGQAPPALVLAHGGPTGAARRELQLTVRYWTSRGWAVVDVDYRGSTGYGRGYRDALRGRWGDSDVIDLAAAVRHLGGTGDIDPARVVTRGSSAGGLTVLGALLAAPEVFAAGAIRYGVTDLEMLARDTHKFEARYLDRLVGPYPEAIEIYRERSPIHHLDRLTRPMLVMQGADDEIVPPSQAEALVAALADKGLPHAYLVFDGEAHGFRRAESMVRALEAEHAFFASILGLEPADELPPVDIVT